MKHIYHTLFVALMLISGAVSCRRQAPELTNPNDLRVNTESPSQVFLAFWQGMNNSYGFWDIDPTDWDAVYDHYLPTRNWPRCPPPKSAWGDCKSCIPRCAPNS